MTRYTHIPTGGEVDIERWRWEVYYTDGSVLKQFDKLNDEHGEFHQFSEIDQSRLRSFHMVTQGGRKLTLLFRPGMKLIHKYRTHIKKVEVVGSDGVTTVDNEVVVRSYFFGYQENGQTVIIFISPTDEIIVTDDPDKIVTV